MSLESKTSSRSKDTPPGWSAMGGQCQSAYVRGGVRSNGDLGARHSGPSGSSSGSAVGVSAGFAPVAIGTETIGSLVMPADRAALFTIKSTIGLVSQQGIIPTSELYDSAGPMAKNSRDVAVLLDVMVDPAKTEVPENGYMFALTESWDGLRVGVVDPAKWLHELESLDTKNDAATQMVGMVRKALEQASYSDTSDGR